jgi:hypothetical protein
MIRSLHSLAVLALASASIASAAGPRAEIQVGLCGEPAAIESALALRPRAAPYETWLFDDPALALFDHGVRIRLRVGKQRAELAVKIANQDCRALPAGLVPPHEGKCEFDVHGDAIAGAVSLTRSLDARDTAALIAGTRPLSAMLSPAQARYLREIVQVDPLPAGVVALGPIANRVYRTGDGAYDVDVSQLPGGQRYAEISTKVPLAQASVAEARLAARLAQAGVTPCADQSAQAAGKLRLLLPR